VYDEEQQKAVSQTRKIKHNPKHTYKTGKVEMYTQTPDGRKTKR
jgi:hypothetical protein